MYCAPDSLHVCKLTTTYAYRRTMAEPPFFSSQGSEYERIAILEEQENTTRQKIKRPPTVTPKRFKKFFTPRTSVSSTSRRQSKAARQLRDITKNGRNLNHHMGALQKPVFHDPEDNDARPLKRRKRSVHITSSPLQSSPLKHVQTAEHIEVFEDQPSSPLFSDEADLYDRDDDFRIFPEPARRLRRCGYNTRILQRSFGGYDALSLGRDHCTDWRSTTADFVSTPQDIHRFRESSLPFCTAACNTNSLIAIGEEEGGIRLIDSSPSSDFANAHVSFRPHHNAIMDIAFNSDDYRLATASGDQTARIIDMHTQQTVCILSGHKSSLKQIRFQPNDDNMLTTSSRDGSVLLWDMRCGNKGTIASLHTAFARNVDNGGFEPTVRYAKYTLDAASAHRSISRNAAQRTSSFDLSDAPGVSITAFQHVTNGREHLLLTTSELNSSIRVWDLRNVGRRSSNALFSTTPVPQSHRLTRNYGINAMAMSGDGARLYTVCRDGSVYAYSTNHFVLDGEPGTQIMVGANGRAVKTPRTGLGPLYGFKHSQLKTGSFYIKAAVREARGDQCELLAIGSSDNCAVVFPTDERHLTKRRKNSVVHDENDDDVDLPTIAAPKPQLATMPGVPIHEHGTALIRGHIKEVTSLTWSHEGALVSIGDDFTARCWRENGDKARQLRSGGEGEGQRWGCGWADVDVAWDEDDD